jgi:solute carrier family 31 (copper transporter), member 1
MMWGSCIGVIFLVVCLEALGRIAKEYDLHLLRKHRGRVRTGSSEQPFWPTPMEQAVRAIAHTMQFGVAYIIMLLAMYVDFIQRKKLTYARYFNGYIIISIIIGALIGSYIFGWAPLNTK